MLVVHVAAAVVVVLADLGVADKGRRVTVCVVHTLAEVTVRRVVQGMVEFL